MVGVAALVMSAAYVLPLWRISLVAPQYPEGLGMLIRVHGIDGFKEGDLQSINGLNHYIGMERIEPDAIPELKLMPVVLGVLILSGLGVAAWGRKAPFIAWSVVLGGTLTAGVVDFWRWGYNYGHNLSPTAIIKIPGMTYQPPLIGSKKLLNFTATSWPDFGGWILIAAAITIAVALVLMVVRRRGPAAAASLSLAAAAACATVGPRNIRLNEDACDFCRMTITDARFGGEAITTVGKTYTFDSIDCLSGWVRTAPAGSVRAIYVIDLQHPGTLIPAETAGFLKDILINTPMGQSVAAFTTATAAEQQRAVLGGRLLSWSELLADTAVHATR